MLDNDVVLKACRYALAAEMLEVLEKRCPAAVLGTAKYVLPRRLARSRIVADKVGSAATLSALLASTSVVEPTQAEVDLAAEFEDTALQLGVALDTGESQLLAVLVLRPAKLMLTGDKRAIAATEKILREPHTGAASGKVACLEQLAATLIAHVGIEVTRARVCANSEADKTLALCFSCSAESCAEVSALEGLSSYVGAVRATAPGLLLASNDLSAFLP